MFWKEVYVLFILIDNVLWNKVEWVVVKVDVFFNEGNVLDFIVN